MDTKDTIIHESLRLFSVKGYFSTSISDILQAVGTSKGGLYNHFKSKEELFYAVLNTAHRIWRERNLAGLNELERPIDKVKRVLENYRDRYLADSEGFPGAACSSSLQWN